MKLIKGRKIADGILADLKKKIKREKLKPGLAVVLIGKDKASRLYVSLKRKAAKKIGVKFFLFKFSGKSREREIIEKIKKLNRDEKIDGILVQLPLPKKFNASKIIRSIDISKDADGFSTKGNQDIVRPVFPSAIMRMIEATNAEIKNKKAIVIANSKKFSGTILAILKKSGARGSCILMKGNKGRNGSKEIDKKIRGADIVITACGIPELIKGDMIKKGAIIIDGGITKVGKKVIGDVDGESVEKMASYLSPVPGGVGPVTVATLLENVYLATKK